MSSLVEMLPWLLPPAATVLVELMWRRRQRASTGVVVHKLFIYPVKSCAGIELTESPIDPLGFEWDRRWLIVDEESNFLTQRQYPLMAVIKPQIESGQLILHAPGSQPLRVPVASPPSPREHVKLWDDVIECMRLPVECDAWLEHVLGTRCHLVCVLPGSQHQRPIPKKYNPSQEYHASFADGFPFLICSVESLDALNARLAEPVSMLNFRPNIVVRGARAFEEDHWRHIAIRGLKFDLCKPCSRCTIPSVDQTTGQRDTSFKLLKVLRAFRAVGEAVYFGQNAIYCGQQGRVAVGDDVSILSLQLTPTAALSL